MFVHLKTVGKSFCHNLESGKLTALGTDVWCVKNRSKPSNLYTGVSRLGFSKQPWIVTTTNPFANPGLSHQEYIEVQVELIAFSSLPFLFKRRLLPNQAQRVL